MISQEWTEPAIVVGVAEWHRGRESDPTLAPQGVPDLSCVPGYSLDDVRYNCVGLQSPVQKWQTTKRMLLRLVWIGVAGASTAFALVHGAGLISGLALVLIAAAALKTLFDWEATWAGSLSQVDGDIWTERVRDSESPDRHFVHIDGLKLEITKDAYAALVTGGPYRIYYVPGAKRALGGQVLPAWRPLPSPEAKGKSWWRRISIEL